MRFLVIIFVCISISSCDLFSHFLDKKDSNPEPRYIAKIAWDSGLYSNYYQGHIVHGDSVYFFERPPGYTSVNIYSLTKLNVKTGELIWRSSIFGNIMFCQPVFINNHCYVFIEPNIIICFNTETGNHIATIMVENDTINLSWNPFAYQQYIYLSYWLNKEGYFSRLDANIINYNEEPNIVQTVYPELLWRPETNSYPCSTPFINNNVIYADIYSGGYHPVELAGFNIDTRKMVFYTTFGGPEDGDVPFPEKGGDLSQPIFIYDDILYYLSWSIAAWDLKTGEQLYRHVFGWDVPAKMNYMANGVFAPVYYNSKIYYAQRNSYATADSRNIHCIDAATGTLVWNAIAKDSETLETNPIIAHGKLYISQFSGFRVYDAETGKLLGVDKSFCGMGSGRNILYNDLIICVQMNRNTGEGKLVAVDVSK